MKPFTLKWWRDIEAQYIHEAFKIVYTEELPFPDRYEELREITGWIDKRIIDKYGE